MATTTYRYLFADLLTNSILAELPITGVNFTQQLNSAGTFTGHLLLSGVNAAGLNVANGTIPGRTAVYVDRNGVLVWGGVLWGREYDSTSQSLTFQAREFESYFERRRITTTRVFSNTDQLTIAQTLVNDAQATASGNIGVVVPVTTSGVLVSRTYYAYELKGVYPALQDLSRQTNGFDMNIEVAYDGGGNPTKTLLLSYPRAGTAYTSSSKTVPTFEFPAGNVVEYNYPEDGSIAANTVYALGAGSNEGKLIATATDTSKTSSGWAILEEQANYSDVTDATMLAGLASGQVAAVSYPPTTLKITVPPYENPTFGTYKIGDDARVIINDNRFPTGLNSVFRIVAFNVAPGENGPERVTLTLTTGTGS
jgi:hypothetical protein